MGKALGHFKERLEEATAGKGPDNVPNATAIAVDGTGKTLYDVSSGTYKTNPKGSTSSDPKPFDGDVICWIASCTKLMTTVSVMQCVEKGLLDLDADVGEANLPEFKDVQVLEKMEDDGNGGKKPVLRAPKSKVTLRNLLTHTSGVSYEFTSPTLAAWRQWSVLNSPDGAANHKSKDIGVAFRTPLLFDPGEKWAYGYGIDWAGLAVMRATGKTLEEYMTENIWGPLGMKSTTFDPWVLRSDLASRVTGMMARNAEKNLVNGDDAPFVSGIGAQDFSGGGGAWSTANDYIKLVTSLLKTMKAPSPDPEHDLLKASTLAEMIDQTMSPPASALLNAIVSSPMAAGLAGNIPGGVKVVYGLGGIVTQAPIDKPTHRATDASITAGGTGRAAGSIQWCGLANCHWWISPGDGVCGVFFGQILPAGDNAHLRLYEEFEGAVLQDLKGGATNGIVH